MAQQYFTNATLRFLKDLKKNNNREWFQANKSEYEKHVKEPMLRFIADLAPALQKINQHLVADPKPNGGSMFRIYRDVRFSADKSPYKTAASAYFPHVGSAQGVAAPGLYLHLEPGQCFGGGGLWHPDSHTLTRVRTAIVQQTPEWKRLRSKLEIGGDKLSRPPRGFPADHPFAEDLKHKDYVCSVQFSDAQIAGDRFLQDYVAACKQMAPLIQFLSRAVGLPW